MNIARFEVREWIDPWRDRRPMTSDEVLVTVWSKGEYVVKTAWYYNDEWTILSFGRFDTALAWMPLPEPYNPVEEEDDED